MTLNSSRLPFGEQLTDPSPLIGAVATKNTGWASIHAARRSLTSS
jgi:hypothetical protein